MGGLGGKLLIAAMGVARRWTLAVQVHLQQDGDVEADLCKRDSRDITRSSVGGAQVCMTTLRLRLEYTVVLNYLRPTTLLFQLQVKVFISNQSKNLK